MLVINLYKLNTLYSDLDLCVREDLTFPHGGHLWEGILKWHMINDFTVLISCLMADFEL